MFFFHLGQVFIYTEETNSSPENLVDPVFNKMGAGPSRHHKNVQPEFVVDGSVLSPDLLKQLLSNGKVVCVYTCVTQCYVRAITWQPLQTNIFPGENGVSVTVSNFSKNPG